MGSKFANCHHLTVQFPFGNSKDNAIRFHIFTPSYCSRDAVKNKAPGKCICTLTNLLQSGAPKNEVDHCDKSQNTIHHF